MHISFIVFKTFYQIPSQFLLFLRQKKKMLLSKSAQQQLLCRRGNGNPLQYPRVENPMDGGAWQAAVHGVAKSQTRLSDFTFTFHFHALETETATHSSVPAWRIPGMAEPGGLPSMGSHRVRHNLAAAAAAAWAQLLHSMWDLPTSGIESMSPALADIFFTTEPPKKPCSFCFKLLNFWGICYTAIAS